MRTPYDNGKVLIGSRYEPPKYVEQDPDMLTLQKGLIWDCKASKRKRRTKIFYWTFIALAFVSAVINA
jgi:hypothetical protein